MDSVEVNMVATKVDSGFMGRALGATRHETTTPLYANSIGTHVMSLINHRKL